MALPVSFLCLTVLLICDPKEASDAVQLDFKWWDNAQKPGEITDTYLSGDCAPDARFNYRFTTAQAPR